MSLCSNYLFADLSWGERLLETCHGGAQMWLRLGTVAPGEPGIQIDLGGPGVQIDPASLS